MVKLTGPGMATGASGTLAGQITFSKWKGTAYLKTKSRPKQPDSPGQVAMRQVMSFLAGAWRTISPTNQATWQGLADLTEISPFNAYQKCNLMRWRTFQAPSQIYPPSQVLPYSNYSSYNVTGGTQHVAHVVVSTAQLDGWGYLIHHLADTGDDRRWGNLYYILPVPSPGTYNFTTSPHPPGTHYWMATNFSIDGKMRDYSFKRTCTVLP